MTTASPDCIASPVAVGQVSLPAGVRALSTLSRLDYYDAFLVHAGVERTPEQWARAVIRDAPLAMRARLVSGWLSLGLRLGPPWTSNRLLGWRVQQSSPRSLLLKADSWLGLRAELLFHGQPGGLLFATLIQQSNVAARGAWTMITPTHQAVVRSLLAHAAGREASRRDGDAEPCYP